MAEFRITVTGNADPVFVASLIEDLKRMTPVDGGFTFQYGTHATQQGDNDNG
jgi:hypothetical protein